jgi:hypothetical protein
MPRRASRLIVAAAATALAACGGPAGVTTTPGGSQPGTSDAPTPIAARPTVTPSAADAATSVPTLAVTTPDVPAQPYGVARNGLLAYALDGDILVEDLASRMSRVIIPGPTRDEAPEFSRDGRRLSFARLEGDDTARLMMANVDGANVVDVLGGPVLGDWVAWSPDSTQFVVLYQGPDGQTLAIVDAEASGHLRQLDIGDLQPVVWTDWHADRIFFKAVDPVARRVGIYSIAADGSGLKPVVITDGDDVDASLQQPRVSPDGAFLGYWTWGPDSDGNVDGWGHILNLATDEDRLEHRFSGPAFSPDGLTVVGDANGLVVGRVDGSGAVRELGPDPVEGFSNYDFSPDGTLVYWNHEEPSSTTWIIDLATGDSIEIPAAYPPAWQRLAP